jgi:hypothetical protein
MTSWSGPVSQLAIIRKVDDERSCASGFWNETEVATKRHKDGEKPLATELSLKLLPGETKEATADAKVDCDFVA